MVALTSRAVRVVRLLLESDSPISVQQISRRVGACERAIRYDLQGIELWLREYRLRLCRKPRVGVWVEGRGEDRAAALAVIAGEPTRPAVVATKEDRPWLILGWVLSSAEPVRVRFLARILGVCERTIYYDLARLKEWLRGQGLELVCNRGRVSLSGNEIRCRSLMLEFLERYAGSDGLAGLVAWVRDGQASGLSQVDPLAGRCLRQLLEQVGDPNAASKVYAILAQAQQLFGVWLGANQVGALVAHILVAVARLRQGRYAPATRQQVRRLRQRPEWAMASWIAQSVEGAFGISVPAAEVGYVALYLATGGLGMSSSVEPDGKPLPCLEELGLCARTIAEKAGEALGVDLLHDAELRAGLVAHLYSSLEKIRAGLPIRNPLLDEIRARYPLIHGAARNAAREAGTELGVEIPEEEAGWIALHIGAALERMAQRRRSWRGLVACASGVGIARMLRARLASEFPYARLRVASAAEPGLVWREASAFKADVVISTIKLAPGPVPVVVVSPFLPPRDIRKIADVVYGKPRANEVELLRACKSTLADVPPSDSAGSPGMRLGELVREDLIAVGVPVADAEEAIMVAGRMLVDGGLVSPDYVQAMVNLYRRLGPYIVVAPGVALPHASPEDGAFSLGLSVVLLKEAVAFGSPHNDPVDVVISFACPDYCSHVRALMDLFHRLQHGLAARLRCCRVIGEVIEAIREPV